MNELMNVNGSNHQFVLFTEIIHLLSYRHLQLHLQLHKTANCKLINTH